MIMWKLKANIYVIFFCYLLAAIACYDISFMNKMLNLRDLNKIARSEVES
jgi:hypothetical protein